MSGLKEVWAWAKELELKPTNSFKNIEIQKGIPKNWT
jgi:hypothetical protein